MNVVSYEEALNFSVSGMWNLIATTNNVKKNFQDLLVQKSINFLESMFIIDSCYLEYIIHVKSNFHAWFTH